MGRTLAAFVVAASLLTLASSEASAWVCYATGLGSGGYARAYDIIDAKLFALRRCERGSPVPVCTLLWCAPVADGRRRCGRVIAPPACAGGIHFDNALSIAALTPTSASGVSTSTSAALPSSGTSTTASP